MITLTCKSYRARVEGGQVVLEIDNAQPANFVPQLMSKADVARRLAISERKVETLAAAGHLPVVRVDSCVRFNEVDVLRYLTEHQSAIPRKFISELPARWPKPFDPRLAG